MPTLFKCRTIQAIAYPGDTHGTTNRHPYRRRRQPRPQRGDPWRRQGRDGPLQDARHRFPRRLPRPDGKPHDGARRRPTLGHPHHRRHHPRHQPRQAAQDAGRRQDARHDRRDRRQLSRQPSRLPRLPGRRRHAEERAAPQGRGSTSSTCRRPSTTTSGAPTPPSASTPRWASPPNASTACTARRTATTASSSSRSWATAPAGSRSARASPAAPT